MTVGKIDLDENMRALCHNKSNLAPAGVSQAFALDPVCGFTWLGEYDINIDEILGGVKKPESQFAKARRLIESSLANGPVPAADMEQMAEEQGISPKTLNRAKSALGVISAKRGGKWYWVLPIEAEFSEVSQDGQDGQHGHDGQGSKNSQYSQDVAQGGQGKSVTALTTLTIFNNGTER